MILSTTEQSFRMHILGACMHISTVGVRAEDRLWTELRLDGAPATAVPNLDVVQGYRTSRVDSHWPLGSNPRAGSVSGWTHRAIRISRPVVLGGDLARVTSKWVSSLLG
jgi:hypothetical protein